MSEQYWKNFSELTLQAMSGLNADQPATPKWQDGLEQWSRLFQGAMGSSEQQNGLDQMLDHGRGYLRFMQELAQNGGQFDPSDLRGAAERMIEEFKTANPLLQAFPMQGTKFGDVMQQLMGWLQQAAAPGKDQAQSWLKMPAFGMAREYQEQAQAYAQAKMDQREASARYHALMAQSMESGIERFQAKLEERGEQGRGIENLRGLYDVFIDALEESYAEMAVTEDFGRAYGELVDSQSRVKLSTNKAVEQICRSLGVPTRSEVDTLEQRLHEVRRAAKKQVNHPALNELKAEVDELRAEMAALKAARGVGEHDDDDRSAASGRATPAKRSPARAGRKPVVATRAVNTPSKTAKSATARTAAKPAAAKTEPKPKPALKSTTKSAPTSTKSARKAKES